MHLTRSLAEYDPTESRALSGAARPYLHVEG